MGKPTGFLEFARQERPCVPPKERMNDFQEFHRELTGAERREQGGRCMNCGVPFCQSDYGCPLHNLIPEWNDEVFAGNIPHALSRLLKTNDFPEFTGRVCPALCENACVCSLNGEAVTVRDNELAIVEEAWAEGRMVPAPPAVRTGKRVAVVGSGPAGLTCAGDLARMGYDVTVYELFHKAGGVLVYGIPEFRLPKAIVAREVAALEEMGVKVVTDAVVGRAISVDDLLTEEGFEAVFLGSGAGLPRFLGIPGESLLGVYSANEYLTRINLMKAYRDDYDTPIKHHKCVAVVGAGNVAMDAARCAKRMGAEKVYIVYRRSMEEVPARKEEVHHAIEEEVEFKLLTNPVRVIGDEKGYVTGIECIQMELGEPDEKGRRRPIPVPDSNFVIEVDAMIDALGTSPNPLLRMTTEGLEADKHGCLIADEKGKTTREGVYAGGDAVTGAATVILAMGAGKTAAAAIDEYIKSKNA